MPIIKNVNELNERITVLSVEPTPGPFPGESEQELFSCWAKIRTQNIKDVKEYSGTKYEDTLEVVLRQQQEYRITNQMKIYRNEKKYNIIKVNPDTAFKEFMVLVVKE